MSVNDYTAHEIAEEERMARDKPAFPVPIGITEGLNQSGLTRRELFAAMAMTGAFAARDFDWVHPRISARRCADAADALIAELDK